MVYTRKYSYPKKRTQKEPIKNVIRNMISKSIDRKMETKNYVDNSTILGMSSVGNLGVIYDLSALIIQGVGAGQRIGNVIELKEFELFTTLLGGQTGSAFDDPYNVVRYALLHVSDINIGVPVFNQYLKGTTTNGLLAVYSPKNVLLKPSHALTVGYSEATSKVSYRIRFKKGLKLTYSGQNGTANSPLVLWMASDSHTIPHPGLTNTSGNGYMRLTFKDV